MTTTLILSRAVLCYLLCFAATSSLHSKMFKSILRTPVLFFDTNPVGEYRIMCNVCSYICSSGKGAMYVICTKQPSWKKCHLQKNPVVESMMVAKN